jgi:uncharacterized protein involved in outer membrane biogenesis
VQASCAGVVVRASMESPFMWQRFVRVLGSLPVRIAAGLVALYLVFGFFLVDPLARKVLPWVGETYLASRLGAEEVKFNPLTLELNVRGLTLAEPDGALLAGFDHLYVDLDLRGLARWAWRIRSLQVDHPQARIDVRQGGKSNWARLQSRLQEVMGPPSNTMARVLIDHLAVAEGDIRYTDANRPGEPFKAVLSPLGLTLDGLSTLPEDRGDYLLAAKLSEQGGTLKWKGEVALNPLASQGELALEGARIGKVVRAVSSPLAAEPTGTLAVTTKYNFAFVRTPAKVDVPSLTLTDANVVIQDLALAPRGGGEPLLQVGEARIADASFDLGRRELAVGSVSLAHGKVQASRDAKGLVDWQALVDKPEGAPAAAPPVAEGAETPWKLTVRELRVADWTARWTDRTFAQPLSTTAEGFELTAAVAGELGATNHLTVGPVNASVGHVQMLSGTEPVAQLQRVTLTNAGVELPANRVRIDTVMLSGARSTLAFDAQQRLNWAEILRRPDQALPGGGSAVATLPDLQIGKLAADDIQLQLVDASTATPVRLDLADGAIALQDVSLDLKRAVPVDVRFALQQGGRFEAKGTVVPGQPSGRMDFRLAGLSLKPFAPYLNQFARLRLDGGAVGTQGKLTFDPGSPSPRVAVKGGFAVEGLAIREEDTGDPFLGWKKLSSDNVRVALGPDRRVSIGELVALEPFGKVIIFEDRSLNLQHMRRAEAVPAAATTTPSQPMDFPVAVERLRIVGAGAEFADLSLTPQFGARMQELNGIVTGLSTDPASAAQVELDGKVDEYGSVRIRGTVQPFRATEFTDLELAFRNLEMTRLTPYSGKFAGRKIASGKMSVDLEYKVQQRQLQGTNRFVVNQLKLGEAVDSPDAMKLPLDLAIALLQDGNGVINLDLPVSGSLDDPKFSYGALVWKAVVNVLTKLVTAPFHALAAILGVDAEKVAAPGFDPGSSALLPPEQEKLKMLADALAKRPALTVTIEPGYDPAADRLALQEAEMRRQAAAAAGVQLAAGEAPGPVDVNLHKVQTWLEDRYIQSAGKADYEKLRASFQDPNASTVSKAMDLQFVERLGRQFKPRDTGPPSAFHAELLQRLTQKVPISDEALIALAKERATAMRAAMVKFGVDESRVAIGTPAQRPSKDKLVTSELALGAGKAPAPPAPTTALLVPRR